MEGRGGGLGEEIWEEGGDRERVGMGEGRSVEM